MRRPDFSFVRSSLLVLRFDLRNLPTFLLSTIGNHVRSQIARIDVSDLHRSKHGARFERGSVPAMARKDISLSDSELAETLAQGHTLQVATIDRDGFPHLAPMWYVMRDGQITFRSFTKSQKIVNVRRNPKIAVLLESGESYGELRGVMIRGNARLVDDRSTVLSIYGELAAKYPMVGGNPMVLSDEALEAAFGHHAEKNTAVIVEVEKTSSWDHTKLGGAY